jgi:hypothetical protein
MCHYQSPMLCELGGESEWTPAYTYANFQAPYVHVVFFLAL